MDLAFLFSSFFSKAFASSVDPLGKGMLLWSFILLAFVQCVAGLAPGRSVYGSVCIFGVAPEGLGQRGGRLELQRKTEVSPGYHRLPIPEVSGTHLMGSFFLDFLSSVVDL